MNDVKFRLMSLVSSSVIKPVSVSITAPMVQAVSRVRIIVNISRNFKNTFVGLFMLTSKVFFYCIRNCLYYTIPFTATKQLPFP